MDGLSRRPSRVKVENHFYWCEFGASIIVYAMNKEMTSQTEADEEILAFDVPDALLEQAGRAEQKAFTLFYCTSPSYGCSVPH